MINKRETIKIDPDCLCNGDAVRQVLDILGDKRTDETPFESVLFVKFGDFMVLNEQCDRTKDVLLGIELDLANSKIHTLYLAPAWNVKDGASNE